MKENLKRRQVHGDDPLWRNIRMVIEVFTQTLIM